MRIFALILISLLCFTSCKSRANVITKKSKKERSVNTSTNAKAEQIVDFAERFKGVRYKYGGTTKKGMDCSGLVQTSYKSEAILLPRTTKDLSKSGNWIDLKKVQKGDLLFFATKKNSRKVNHVGIVTYANKKDVEFIHASTSKGVIISSLSNNYWYHTFVQARRVL